MTFLKVAAAVLNQTALAWDSNAANIRDAIEEAKRRQVQVLCLPELCISGYGCEDAFQSRGVSDMALTVLKELVPTTTDIAVSFGLPVCLRDELFNVACLAVDGKISGFVGKQNLAGQGLHYEPRWFKPWPNNAHAQFSVGDASYPIGDLIFDCNGVRIGFEICEDAWVLDRPGGELAQLGVDILLNPSASHFAFAKHQIREQLVLDGSRSFSSSYLYANHLGNEAGRAIYDGGAMIASNGVMLARGPRLTYHDYHLTIASIDIETLRSERAGSSHHPLPINSPLSHTVQVDYSLSFDEDAIEPTTPSPWESSSDLKEEEFARAEALGLFDYLRKSRSCGFVVSLSGGADSAAVATLVAVMVKLAVDELGVERLCQKLAHIAALDGVDDAPAINRHVLTCVYQATRNSGDVTLNAARTVAESHHAEFYVLDVDSVVQSYISIVSGALDRSLSWETDDLTLQNIQARARGPGVWMFANLNNALLLATSNRSEAAVGYATMDGDTCGGLSPIAGIDKNFLRHWLRWMQSVGPVGLGPYPALKSVNDQQPTAELRPPSEKQTDEADLMPYDVLDVIERAAIRDRLSPVECYARAVTSFRQYSPSQLLDWTERFFQLWCRNQWKRERYAPSFHLDDENLDPKTWCRFPILSGNYRRELRELREAVAKR